MSARWLPLGNGISIATTKTHTFGTDAVLLAHFASPQDGENICDLGTGCGIIPFLWARDGLNISVTGVDCQSEAIELANESKNRLDSPTKLQFINADLCEWTPTAPFSLIVCNPPYFPQGNKRCTMSRARKLARQEGIGCTFDELCQTVARTLGVNGRFCFCHRPENAIQLKSHLSAYGLSVKKTATVFHSIQNEPFLWLCETVREPVDCVSTDTWILQENGVPTLLYKQIYAPFFKESSL